MTWDLLVQRGVSTTMISAQALNRDGEDLRNPADGL
jgi:hypothetical protein